MEESVFLDEAELKRLTVQGELLREYEQPVYQKVIAGRNGLALLDVGCNDGWKTKDRFSEENFSKVIGIDCLEPLVEQAKKNIENEFFSFYVCDVTLSDFTEKLQRIMQEEHIGAFDVIHCSFLFMHLKNPGEILKILKCFLAPEGKLIVIEPDDTESYMTADPDGMFQAFLDVLSKDPYAGKRTMGGELPELLIKNGYKDIKLECSEIFSSGSERTKKERIFNTFCSYLPEDLLLLRKQEPDDIVYQTGCEWVQNHFEKLHQQMTAEETTISMGVKIYTCRGE